MPAVVAMTVDVLRRVPAGGRRQAAGGRRQAWIPKSSTKFFLKSSSIQ
ncbi:hypothetical protein SAMN05192544_100696 [Paraburkholderia hospita]|nr:hypothetical protein SAMN05192544_100696 [Paraburkholderia hospita]